MEVGQTWVRTVISLNSCLKIFLLAHIYEPYVWQKTVRTAILTGFLSV